MEDDVILFSARYYSGLPKGFFDTLKHYLLECIPGYGGPIACGEERRKEFIFNSQCRDDVCVALEDACSKYATRVRFDEQGAVISRGRIS